jgi:hypothetical protein
MIQATLPRRTAPQFDLNKIDLNKLAQQALQPWADAYDSWRTGVDNWNSGVADLVRPSKSAKSGCGCPVCAEDPCSCRCCVSDADLVIEARVLERRVVPVIIENRWRRERDIEVELSSWTKVSDTVQVRAEIAGDTAFKLAPCGQAEVVLMITVATEKATTAPSQNTPGKTLPGKTIGKEAQGKASAKESAAAAETVIRRGIAEGLLLPDVDRCLVSYADLRIKGCDLRSVRIAVAILPRDCDAYVVDCACGCC